MATRQVEVRVRRVHAMAVLELGGDITSQSSAGLMAAYDEALVSDPAAVLLDLSAVDYINSTGIALLVGLLSRARSERRRLLACGLSPHYVEVFEITRLADHLAVVADEAAALAALGDDAP